MIPSSVSLPEVAVVGRPNVGKSALFNRLARRRIAIVHGESGVTRDRIVTEVSWRDRRFRLVDTGGIAVGPGEEARSEMEKAIVDQAVQAIADADLVLFAVDALAGITALDEEVADRLRVSGKPVILVANKADNDRIEREALAEFARFGFDRVRPVSALHGLATHELLDEIVSLLPEDAAGETEPAEAGLALVGRPNVGKSSLLNRILKEERSIVSPVPGTTRDAVDVPFVLRGAGGPRRMILIDTAGLRRTSKIPTAVERIGVHRAEKSIRRCDLAVLLLDAVAGPTRQDKHIASLILRNRKGCIVAVNKWDIAPERDRRLWRREIEGAMPFLGFAPLVFVSARTGEGLGRLLQAVDHVAAQIETRLPTGPLNRIVAQAAEAAQPPRRRRKRLKIFYAVQTDIRPITLRIFVNDPRIVARPWEQFLERRLREAFGLEGAPIAFHWKSRPRSKTGSGEEK